VVVVAVVVVVVVRVVVEVVDVGVVMVGSKPSVGGVMERRQEKTVIAVAMKMMVITSSASALQPAKYFIFLFNDSKTC
jgi:hypothetical protein